MSVLDQRGDAPVVRRRPTSGGSPTHGSRQLFAWLALIGGIVLVQVLQGLQALQILVLAVIALSTAAVPLATGVRRPIHHPSVIALGLLAMFAMPKAIWIALNGTDVHQVQFNVCAATPPLR